MRWPADSFVLGPVGSVVLPTFTGVDVLTGGYVVVRDGKIDEITTDEPRCDLEVVDARSYSVLPGFVDAHTHAVFGGWRWDEYEMRLAGRSYGEIMARGGGIVNTVRSTREMTEEQLVERTVGFLKTFARCGVTTVEIKSGYGLQLADELKQLRAAKAAGEQVGVRVVCTFMGAHAVPVEFKGRADEYVDVVVEEMLPEVRASGLAEFCDVFCEQGAFTAEQSERVLEKAIDLGFGVKIHAEELARTGGAMLAARVGAVSAEHLLYAERADIEALADSGVVAVLLPGTSFHLQERFAPARDMIDGGMNVAVATDFNPGSSPVMDIRFCMNLACSRLGLRIEETLQAVTVHGAKAVGRKGGLCEGGSADFSVWKVDDYRQLIGCIGSDGAVQTYVGGRPVFEEDDDVV